MLDRIEGIVRVYVLISRLGQERNDGFASRGRRKFPIIEGIPDGEDVFFRI
ncbi:hypothetical protein LRS73_08420 [Methylobacterium currus]|uniref:hypothetical protein n=1 Tax=Methylobacterium currus TaxID=2051553 RepID=UPI001E2A6B83|nr:hypothetical protein [Methylobacterium currus]UHC17866.1 hypothetical protein LRS73_08420 [Methylobacterium currus]